MIFKELLERSGITHIEELPVNKFLEVLKNLQEYEITEKIDGSEILFGIDASGFYTSRETKGGNRIYNSSEYPKTFSTSYMRSVHEALEKVLPLLEEAGLRIGDQVEAEVLYGEIPNAIPYSRDVNRIIFLRTTEGFVNVEKLKKNLIGTIVEVAIDVPKTKDGIQIELVNESTNWEFSKTPTYEIDYNSLNKLLNKSIKTLESYLNGKAGIEQFLINDILNLSLNKKPEWIMEGQWKESKQILKVKKEQIKKHLYFESEEHTTGLISEIKEFLLDVLVRNKQSKFGPSLEEGGSIEGIVLRHKKTGEQIKVVDKRTFTEVRDFIWSPRKKLTEKAYSPDESQSFLGKLLVGLSSSIGHPELGTKSAKRYMKLLGENKEEIMLHLLENSSHMKLDEIKEYWCNFLNQKEKELIMELYYYDESISDLKSHYSPDRKIMLMCNESVISRNKQGFADMFLRIETMKKKVEESNNFEDLLMILVADQLGEI